MGVFTWGCIDISESVHMRNSFVAVAVAPLDLAVSQDIRHIWYLYKIYLRTMDLCSPLHSDNKSRCHYTHISLET